MSWRCRHGAGNWIRSAGGAADRLGDRTVESAAAPSHFEHQEEHQRVSSPMEIAGIGSLVANSSMTSRPPAPVGQQGRGPGCTRPFTGTLRARQPSPATASEFSPIICWRRSSTPEGIRQAAPGASRRRTGPPRWSWTATGEEMVCANRYHAGDVEQRRASVAGLLPAAAQARQAQAQRPDGAGSDSRPRQQLDSPCADPCRASAAYQEDRRRSGSCPELRSEVGMLIAAHESDRGASGVRQHAGKGER